MEIGHSTGNTRGNLQNLTARELRAYRTRPASYLCRWTSIYSAVAAYAHIFTWASYSYVARGYLSACGYTTFFCSSSSPLSLPMPNLVGDSVEPSLPCNFVPLFHGPAPRSSKLPSNGSSVLPSPPLCDYPAKSSLYPSQSLALYRMIHSQSTNQRHRSSLGPPAILYIFL